MYISDLAKLLLADNYGSHNDGKLIVKALEMDLVQDRWVDPGQAILDSGLDFEDIKNAYKKVVKYQEAQATGANKIAAYLEGFDALDGDLQGSFDELIRSLATPLDRYHYVVEHDAGSEALFEKVALHAELTQVPGVDTAIGRALYEYGVVSVSDLANASTRSVRNAFRAYAKSPFGWATDFEVPSVETARDLIAAAQRFQSQIRTGVIDRTDFATMPTEVRAKALMEVDGESTPDGFTAEYMSVKDFQDLMASDVLDEELKALELNFIDVISQWLEENHLADGIDPAVDTSAALHDDYGVDWRLEPSVEVIKDELGTIAGAVLSYSIVHPADNSLTDRYVFDAAEGRITGRYLTWDEYDTDDDEFELIEAGSIQLPSDDALSRDRLRKAMYRLESPVRKNWDFREVYPERFDNQLEEDYYEANFYTFDGMVIDHFEGDDVEQYFENLPAGSAEAALWQVLETSQGFSQVKVFRAYDPDVDAYRGYVVYAETTDGEYVAFEAKDYSA